MKHIKPQIEKHIQKQKLLISETMKELVSDNFGYLPKLYTLIETIIISSLNKQAESAIHHINEDMMISISLLNISINNECNLNSCNFIQEMLDTILTELLNYIHKKLPNVEYYFLVTYYNNDVLNNIIMTEIQRSNSTSILDLLEKSKDTQKEIEKLKTIWKILHTFLEKITKLEYTLCDPPLEINIVY